MAEFSSFISSNSTAGGASGGPSQRGADVLSGVAAVAETGLNIFSALQQKDAAMMEQQAAAQAAEDERIGTEMAFDFVQSVNEARQGGNPIAANNWASSQYSGILAGLPAQQALHFRKAAVDGLGYNPVETASSQAVKQQEAQQDAQTRLAEQGRDYAVGTIGMPLASYEALTPEAQRQIGIEAQATGAAIAREKSRLELLKAQGEADNVVKGGAINATASIVGDVATQRINGMTVEWEQAIATGDPQIIAAKQMELQQRVALLRSNAGKEITEGLALNGFTGISEAEVANQANAIATRYELTGQLFDSNKWASATKDAQAGAILSTTNFMLNSEATRKTATLIMIDGALGANGQLVQALLQSGAVADAFMSNLTAAGASNPDPQKTAIQTLQTSITEGPANALAASPGSGDNGADKAIFDAWNASLKSSVTSEDPESIPLHAEGIVNLMNSGVTGSGKVQQKAMKGFVPMLDALADPKVGPQYKEALAGSEEVMGAYSSEFMLNTLGPSTLRSLSVNDLGDYKAVQRDGKWIIEPPLRGVGQGKFLGASQAVNRANAARGLQKPMQIIEKMALMSQNVYGVPVDVAREALMQKFAQATGIQLVGASE